MFISVVTLYKEYSKLCMSLFLFPLLLSVMLGLETGKAKNLVILVVQLC